MGRRTAEALLALQALCLTGSVALGDALDRMDIWQSVATRPSLFDYPGSPKQTLRSLGISTDLWITQFYQGLTAGKGAHEWKYGGKADLFVRFDGEKLGLWQGFFVSVHQEWLWGEDVNNRGGTILPVNTAMAFPRKMGSDQTTSIVVTQRFNEYVSLSVGKFNMLDAAARTPLMGGGGIDTFMNLALAAPFSGMVPAYILGANLTVTTQPAIFTVMVYDPRDATNPDVLRNPFSEGTNVLGSVVIPVKIAGLSGFHGFRVIIGNKSGIDLGDIPVLVLPPQAGRTLDFTNDRWHVSYTFQQYLYQNPANPQQGWGIFGQVAVADGNPNPLESSYYFGVGGTSPLPSRTLDRWGIAYFRTNLSNDLQDSLAILRIDLRDESGWELFYNLAVTP